MENSGQANNTFRGIGVTPIGVPNNSLDGMQTPRPSGSVANVVSPATTNPMQEPTAPPVVTAPQPIVSPDISPPPVPVATPPLTTTPSVLPLRTTTPSSAVTPVASVPAKPARKRLFTITPIARTIMIIVGVLLLLAVGITTLVLRNVQTQSSVTAADFNVFDVPFADLVDPLAVIAAGQTMQVNGKLTVNDSVVIAPTLQPSTSTPGQLYYDQTSNQLAYYNGTEYVPLGEGDVTTNTTTNATSNTTINNLSEGNTTSTGGTTNVIPKFTGAANLGNSIMTDEGSQVSVAGNMNLTNTATVQPDQHIIGAQLPSVISDNEALSLELGTKFQSSVAGYVTGVRFYKGPFNLGQHSGTLWTGAGQQLATVIFTNETATGWQEARFSEPVLISANTTYVVSYHAPQGRYSTTNNFFATATTNGPLKALADGEDGSNGLFAQSSTIVFPQNTFQKTFYWVDVIFKEPSGTETGMYKINNQQISSSDLSNGADLAKRGSNQVFTGTNLFRPSLDTTEAFNIQDAGGVNLLIANTTGDGNIIIKDLLVTNEVTIDNDLALGRHIVSLASPTGLSAGAAACTTPSVVLSGNDIAGKISVTTGTGCGALGIMATLDYDQNYDVAPKVTLTPANANATTLTSYITSNVGTFTLDIANGTVNNTTLYEWYYHVIQ